MNAEPLTHIARPPLPWRDSGLTICGRAVTEYAEGRVIQLTEAFAVAKRLGQQRFAMTHCMTCTNMASTIWTTWEVDPVARMSRELVSPGRMPWNGPDQGQMPVQQAELRAIADLILAHREEFDERVLAYRDGSVVTMTELRKRRLRK